MTGDPVVDHAGETLYVGDVVEPLRYSRGPVRVVAFYGAQVLLSDGLTINAADVRYRPARSA